MKKYIKPALVEVNVDSESLMNTVSSETLGLGEAVDAGSARSKDVENFDWNDDFDEE